MIGSVGGLQSFSYAAYYGSSGAGGKLYVPVAPSNVLYSQFDHISGYAARKSDSGVSVDKIRVLNTLIDQLVSIKKQPAETKAPTALSESQIDSIIKDYQSQIKTAVDAAKVTPYALAPAAPQGVLFDLAA